MMTFSRCGVAVLVALAGSLAAAESNASKEAGAVLEGAKIFGAPVAGRDYGRVDPKTLPRPMDAKTFWKIVGEQQATVKLAKTMVVYEGAPMPRAEERDGKVVVTDPVDAATLLEVDQQRFFPKAHVVDDATMERLRTEVFAGVRESSSKLCGFHADYLLKWQGLMAETEVQICFGCRQIRIKNAAGTISGDLAKEQADTLKALLEPYATQGKPLFGTKAEPLVKPGK